MRKKIPTQKKKLASRKKTTSSSKASKSKPNKPATKKRFAKVSTRKKVVSKRAPPTRSKSPSIAVSEKIQKILAHAGIASRRQIERYLEEGRIKVNGKLAKLGDRATVADRFSLNNRSLRLSTDFESRTIIYNKPDGVICTRSDPKKRRNVFQDLPKISTGRWVMIGRLDINTQGLLIFTNDGALANRYMHPSSEIEREYAVRILGKVDKAMLARLHKGVRLEDGLMRFHKIIEKPATDAANRWFHVILKEGKFREVRRLWESQGVKVSRLIRVRFGEIELPRDLPRGRWREIDRNQPL